MEENSRAMVFDDNFDRKLLDEGDYEVILKLEKKTLSTGKEKVSLDFKVRDDVDQKFRGSHIFDDIWPDKNNPYWFDLIKLNKLVKTQKGLPTYQERFNDVDECILFLNGTAMIITVENVYDEYIGNDKSKVKYLSYRPSQHPLGTTNVGSSATTESEKTDSGIVADDLPF